MKQRLSIAVTALIVAMLACDNPFIPNKYPPPTLNTQILSMAVIPPEGSGSFALEVTYRAGDLPNSIFCNYLTPNFVTIPIGNIATKGDFVEVTERLPFSVRQQDNSVVPGPYIAGCTPANGTTVTTAFTVTGDATSTPTVTPTATQNATATPTTTPTATLTPRLVSGTYHVVTSSGIIANSYWTLEISGNQITSSSFSVWDCCPGTRTDPLTGWIEGDKVTIERECSGQGWEGPCHQTYTGSIQGNVIVGEINGTGMPAGGGTWTLYLTP